MLDPHDVEEREGYRVTRPARTISDLSASRGFSPDLLKQAFEEARNRGLITGAETRFGNLPDWLVGSRKVKP
jgi:hypothetical protein